MGKNDCCIMCYFVCAVLNTLHTVNSVLTSEECRRVWLRGDLWSDWLVRTVVLKPPGMVQRALDLLEEHQGKWWYSSVATPIKVCSGVGSVKGTDQPHPRVTHVCVQV